MLRTSYLIDSGPLLAGGRLVADEAFVVGDGDGDGEGVGVSVAPAPPAVVGDATGGKVASGGFVLAGSRVGDGGAVGGGVAAGIAGPASEHARLVAINIVNVIVSDILLGMMASVDEMS